MDRRKSLKLIATGLVAAPAVVAGCKTDDKKAEPAPQQPSFTLDRNPDELKYEQELLEQEKFFTDHEMATITILADIIIPKDEVSGSASDAGVPAFIEFIVKDMPSHQVPLRGGLMWLDAQSARRFGKNFREASETQRLEIVEDIAYPALEYTDEKGAKQVKGSVKPGMEPGIKFFSLMRNLVATGFYTSEIGVKDIAYLGNQPNQWAGVPADVLARYKVEYTDKDLRECV
jgi:hypothetical protein